MLVIPKDGNDHDSALLDGDGRGDFGDSGCLCTTCGLPPLSVHRGKNWQKAALEGREKRPRG